MTQTFENVGAPGDLAHFVTLEEIIGKPGEQGVAWRAHATNRPERRYVVKVCRTTSDTPGISLAAFERECQILAGLRHPNIVQIFDSGKELIRDNATVPHPFYTMEDLGRDAVPLKGALADALIPAPRKLLFCLSALKGAASALKHVHESNCRHGDVKESNILISDPSSTEVKIKLIDFGFSRYLVPQDQTEHDASQDEPQRGSSIRRRRKCTDQHHDIFQLCFMVRRCLDDLHLDPHQLSQDEKKDWPLDYAEFPQLLTLLDEWGSDKPGSKPETADTSEFYNALAALTKSHDLSADVRGAVRYLSIQEIATTAQVRQAFEAIRIPPRQLVLYTERVKHLITTPQFGALRYVRQLGFTHLVYPGAQGTRFEHSLGMYDLACQVVIRMSGHEAFRKWCGSEQQILKFIVAALLHDVGHFPFAHQLEEFKEHDRDVASVRNLVRGHDPRGKQVIADLSDKLRELFSFTAPDIEDVKWLAFSPDEAQDPRPSALTFLRSLLDGPIDLDKLDYIERDAHHCGVPYGCYLDMARLKETMRVIEEHEKPTLAFDSRVIGSLEQFATARHELYANVYWHRAVRSATVMFKHAFYLFHQLAKDQSQLEDLFYKTISDDCVLYKMTELTEKIKVDRGYETGVEAKATAILALLRAVCGRERILYKTVWEKTRDQEGDDNPYGGQFYALQRQKALEIYKSLREDGFLNDTAHELGEHNVLIDCHTDPFPAFQDIRILKSSSDKPTRFEDEAPSVKELKKNFVRQACKIRVFLNPAALKPDYQSKTGRRLVTAAVGKWCR